MILFIALTDLSFGFMGSYSAGSAVKTAAAAGGDILMNNKP